MYGKIIGTGSYVPEQILSNDDLKQFVETDDAWIQERTGIARRHVMGQETTTDMAVHAGERALEAAGVDSLDIQMLIVCTVSSDICLPCAACYVQDKLGAKNAMCFDINVACTGFMMAYNTVQAYIHAGLIQTALIIGTEGLSHLVDWSDRSTCILFGDGAGAAVIRADESAVFHTLMHADGSGGHALTCENAYALRGRLIDTDPAYVDGNLDRDKRTYIGMDGQEVFRFAVKRVPMIIKELLDKMDKSEKDIDLFLLHQANKRIVESVAKRIGTSMDKVPMNLMEYGNTSSASIPILLDELVRSNRIEHGNRVIMAGFGAGLTWAATYLEY